MRFRVTSLLRVGDLRGGGGEPALSVASSAAPRSNCGGMSAASTTTMPLIEGVNPVDAVALGSGGITILREDILLKIGRSGVSTPPTRNYRSKRCQARDVRYTTADCGRTRLDLNRGPTIARA